MKKCKNERTTIIIADDLKADCKTEPGTREKILEHYDEFMAALDPAGDSITVFRCGPSTSPCGPNRDDHQWDGWLDFTDGAGRVNGGSKACSRCGITAMDFDMWDAP